MFVTKTCLFLWKIDILIDVILGKVGKWENVLNIEKMHVYICEG
jgi:hypothetical protein